MFRYGKYFIAILLIVMLFGITSAQGDLDNDGIPDDVDPETVVSASTSLDAGEYIFQNLAITNNATLILESNSSFSGFQGVKITANNLHVGSGSNISADGKGYIDGPGTSSEDYTGAGYGGRGGGGNRTYGSALQPTELGSGKWTLRGGGAIRLIVTDTLTLDGTISTNGDAGIPGASGGSIYVTTNRMEGSGTLLAKGGDSWNSGYYGSGSGGGGGRIAVYYQTSTFTGLASAPGGLFTGWVLNTPPGEEGTVAFIDATQNILYPGHSFRFQENDGPFTYTTIHLNGSRSTVGGKVALSATEFLLDQGSELNLDTPSTATVTASTLHVNGSSTLILSGNETLDVGTILLTNNATLTHVPNGRISLNVPALTLDPTSRIHADGKGYIDGPGTSSEDYTGAGYGGRGGGGNRTYGSALQPTELGSGKWTLRGGGAIRLIVTDTLTLDGTISTNGDAGIPGASGGSIYVTTNRMEGSGTLLAKGGDSWNSGYYGSGSGGGGGRIAVYYQTSTFTGLASAPGGLFTGWVLNTPPGEEGTVAFIDTTQNIMYPGHSFRFDESDGSFVYTKIILNNSRSTINGTVTLSTPDLQINKGSELTLNTPGNVTLTTTDFLIDQGSELTLNTPGMVTVTATTIHINGSSKLAMNGNETIRGNTITLTNSSVLTSVPEGKVYLNIPTLSIDSSSSITADGKGYMRGPGSGTGDSGGGYGGHGGSSPYGSGGVTYGSAIQPVDLGSGSEYINRGGGAIRLNVSDTLNLDGQVTANGDSGIGGSGGSIYITAHTLAGSGSLKANGGNAVDWRQGAGGGGRIAVYYTASTFTGITEAKGGSGGYQQIGGENGTVVFVDTTIDIMYSGNTFRFEENDSPFTYTKIILNNSRSSLSGNVTLTTTDFLIDQGSELTLNTPGMVTVTATTIHINGSSKLTMNGNETIRGNTITLTNSSVLTSVPEGKVYLNIPTLSIDSSSSITADGKGYMRGPGSGTGDSGGGHGGHGGSSPYGSGGVIYGSAIQPVDLGSGAEYINRGGGAIRLNVSDTLNLDGQVTANGDSGIGSSGGSIYIIAHTLAGFGSLKANGGNAADWRQGAGGGGRIAVYYTASTFTGITEAKGGSGGYQQIGGENGTVIISALTSNSPISLIPLTQVAFTNSTLSETIRIKTVKLENTSVRGNMTGTLDIPDMNLVTLTTGSFKDEGFSIGEWNATLEGVSYKGTLEGTVFFSKSDKKILLKGTTKGEIIGVVEGEFTESVAGSGVYDNFFASWQIFRVNNEAISGTLYVNGGIIPASSVDYPSSGLYAIQTMIEGTASGHYSGPLTPVLTHIRVTDPQSYYYGQGFSILSYSSPEGSGSGWTYDRQKSPGITEMHGFLSNPLYGLVTGTLDETTSPLDLFLIIERVDLGLPVMADLEIIQAKSITISPGQTWDYVITIRNNGPAPAENVVVVDSLPAKVTYINSSPGGIYKWDTHEVIWKLGTLNPKTSKTVSVKVTSQWGLPGGTNLENNVMVGTTSAEKDVYLNPDESLYNLQEYLDYKPRHIISHHYLTHTEFQIHLTADPGFNDLYNYATELGYKDSEITGEEIFSDGSQLIQHFMESSDGNTIAIVTKEENPAHPEMDGSTIVGLDKEKGMSVFNRAGKVTISDTGVIIEGSPSPYVCRYSDRLRNCLEDSLPGIGLDVASHAAAPGVKTVIKVSKAIWDSIWMGIDCIACRNPDTPPDEAQGYCEGCSKKLSDIFQDAQDAVPVVGDVTFCGVRAIDPGAYSCTYCTYTTRCPSKWNIFAFPNALITTHCSKDCRVVDASEAYAPDDPHWRGFRLCDKEIRGGKCKKVSGGGAVCIDPKNTVGQPTIIQTARDPNIKFGPEGHVIAGQTLDYRIEYENVGEGIAFGVYFIDILDEDLDASSLTISPVYSTGDSSQIAPAGLYNPGTRTITWITGEVGPHEGGYANISVKVRSDAPDNSEIINYGIVYFPSVPEETRTNAIVSVVGINHPPAVPTNPTPSDNDTEVIKTTGLLWKGSDPDGDALRYDVFFGNTSPLPLLEKDTFSTISNPGVLAEMTTYSWQVIARDPDGAETPGPVWSFSTKSGLPSVNPLPGFSNPPTDPDGDGLYEDLNANGRKDFNDVVLMFNQMQWIAANEPVSAFDFNGNGRIDFNDIVKLFGEI